MTGALKPLSISATFTMFNGEALSRVPLLSFDPPSDSPSALAAGRRMYKPATIRKPVDDTSARLFDAMKQGQRLRVVVITVDREQFTLTGVFIREITQQALKIEEIQMECELVQTQHLLGVSTSSFFER
jgi:hypothetical protein